MTADFATEEHIPDSAYMLDVQRTVMLTPEEEIALTVELAAARNVYRNAILGTGVGLQRVVALLERVHARTLSIERVLAIDLKDEDAVAERRARVAVALPELLRIVTAIRALFGCKGDDAKAARTRRNALRREAIALLDGLDVLLQVAIETLPEVEAARRALNTARGLYRAGLPRASEVEARTLTTLKAARIATAAIREARARFNALTGRLAMANLRLVISLAKRCSGLPFADRVQAGSAGLMRACERFAPSRGLRFSTYATWWIRQGIQRTIDLDGRTVRVPTHATGKLSRIQRACMSLQAALGREPTRGEIAEKSCATPEDVARLLPLGRAALSLNAPSKRAGAGEIQEFGETIEDTRQQEPSDLAGDNESAEHVRAMLGKLPPRVRFVLEHRFGIGVREQTLETVGAALRLSRERVRQIEQAGLKRLRLIMGRHASARTCHAPRPFRTRPHRRLRP